MTEKEYKKNKFGYDKEFNNSKEYMQEFKSIERRSTKWDDIVSFFSAQHSLSRGKVIFIASAIIFLLTPEFAKLAGVLEFLKYYGAAIIAASALFVLTKSDKH